MQITWIGHIPCRIGDELILVRVKIVLLYEHLVVMAVPGPRPVLISPHDAKILRNLVIVGKLVQRHVHQSLAIEPVIVETKRLDTMAGGHIRLRTDGLD